MPSLDLLLDIQSFNILSQNIRDRFYYYIYYTIYCTSIIDRGPHYNQILLLWSFCAQKLIDILVIKKKNDNNAFVGVELKLFIFSEDSHILAYICNYGYLSIEQ